MRPLSKYNKPDLDRLLRAYRRDERDYVLYARRAKTEKTKQYWLNAAAIVRRHVERLEKAK